jgi:hypothetical protein
MNRGSWMQTTGSIGPAQTTQQGGALARPHARPTPSQLSAAPPRSPAPPQSRRARDARSAAAPTDCLPCPRQRPQPRIAPCRRASQLNVPPAGLFTNLANLGWTPGKEQMNKQASGAPADPGPVMGTHAPTPRPRPGHAHAPLRPRRTRARKRPRGRGLRGRRSRALKAPLHRFLARPAQGNWWLNAFAHYGPDKELLLFHRVTGELGLGRGTPLVRPRPQRGGDVACQSAGARPWPEDSPSAL